MKLRLRGAIAAAPRDPMRSLADLERYASDAYLDGLIAGAFRLLAAQNAPESMAPEYRLPQMSATQARQALSQHIPDFFAAVIAWHARPFWRRPRLPPRISLQATVGVGKSSVTRHQLAGVIIELKAQQLPYRILYVVPEHRLAAEVLQALAAAGVHVAVWPGRSAADPAEPGAIMCRNLDAVADALSVGADVEKDVCTGCPLRSLWAISNKNRWCGLPTW